MPAQFKVLRHCLCAQGLRHDTGAFSQNYPCQRTAQQRIAHADPCGRYAVAPAKLSGISDENDCGKIGCAISEGGQPRAYVSSAQHEIIDRLRLLGRVYADAHHNCNINDDHPDCDCGCHNSSPLCDVRSQYYKLFYLAKAGTSLIIIERRENVNSFSGKTGSFFVLLLIFAKKGNFLQKAEENRKKGLTKQHICVIL